jgi:hypothetical protein
MVASVLNLVRRTDPTLRVDYSSFTLFIVGTICLSLLADRVYLNQRLEDDVSKALSKINTLSADLRDRLIKAILDLVSFQQAKRKAALQGNAFANLGDRIFDNHMKLINSLADGDLLVPGDQTAFYQRQILDYYYRRFDAVSEDDINFWIRPTLSAGEYFTDLSLSVSRRETIVNRILVLTIHDVCSRFDEILEIIKKHHRHRKGIAIAIEETLHPTLRQNNAPRDFALFDGSKAVSYFTNKSDPDGWWFKVSFAVTPQNERNIATQKQVLVMLLAECWLVNGYFVANYPELQTGTTESGAAAGGQRSRVVEEPFLNDREAQQVLRLTEASNRLLRERVGSEVELDCDPFPLVVRAEEEAQAKLFDLRKILAAHYSEMALGGVVESCGVSLPNTKGVG